MIKIENTQKARELFAGIQETLIWSCLEGTMGSIYAEEAENPRSAMAMLGDFCFFAGQPEEALAAYKPPECKRDFMIMVPADVQWGSLIEAVYRDRARKVTRFATKKQPGIFRPEKLRQLAENLPEGYELQQIGKEIYDFARQSDWAADWVSQFPDYESYEKNGLGIAAVKDGVPVSGASSYSFYREGIGLEEEQAPNAHWCSTAGKSMVCGGIEIEVDTHPAYRRKGLAAACAAGLILECGRRGLYPSWDAQNPYSLALARKLGYEYDYDYTAYEITGY